MPKKKITKKPARKIAKKPAGKKRADLVVGECLKGGDHQWISDDEGTYCSKCLESQGKRGKTPPATKTRFSAIDAAAKILTERDEPMNVKSLIEAMTERGYWTSPAGKTPWATLSSAIQREIKLKGAESRFRKSDRGLFATNA